MKKYLSQAYCCSECDKFVIAYTTHLNEPYEYMFFDCKVLARDSYCPFCGKKSISGDEPPWDELERNMKRMYGMPGMPEEPEDDDDDRYRRTKDTWWDIEENDEDPENP